VDEVVDVVVDDVVVDDVVVVGAIVDVVVEDVVVVGAIVDVVVEDVVVVGAIVEVDDVVVLPEGTLPQSLLAAAETAWPCPGPGAVECATALTHWPWLDADEVVLDVVVATLDVADPPPGAAADIDTRPTTSADPPMMAAAAALTDVDPMIPPDSRSDGVGRGHFPTTARGKTSAGRFGSSPGGDDGT
jgi:hypothetical protein